MMISILGLLFFKKKIKAIILFSPKLDKRALNKMLTSSFLLAYYVAYCWKTLQNKSRKMQGVSEAKGKGWDNDLLGIIIK